MTQPVPGREFDVTGQVPRERVNPQTGVVEKVYEVHFTDAVSGVSDSVTIPAAVYSAEAARALILHRLEQLRAVASLNG